MKTVVSTTIMDIDKLWLKEKNIKVNYALATGVRHLKEKEELGYERTEKMQENITQLQKIIQNEHIRIIELETELGKVKNFCAERGIRIEI